MSGVRTIETAAKRRRTADETELKWSPVFDTDRAAGALTDFMEAAREMLDQMETFSDQAQAQRPWRRARRDLLRFLAGARREVEFHDLPRVPDLGGGPAKSLVLKLAEEGLVEARRDETYPNMLYVRINREGETALRKLLAEEAMGILHGVEPRLYGAVGAARDALERLVEVVEAR